MLSSDRLAWRIADSTSVPIRRTASRISLSWASSASRGVWLRGCSNAAVASVATGLLVLLSGAATRLAPCFVGLDKRYVTEIDLTATTTTGDPEGEIVERHGAPDDLDAQLELLARRGGAARPAHSAVKIGGERAYKLARRAPPSRCRCAARRSTRWTCSRGTASP